MKLTRVTRVEKTDLPDLLPLYALARSFMRRNGNRNQWNHHYPSEELLLSDIEKKQLYVIRNNGRICGAFAFITGEDPTYSFIESGAWLSDKPYGTIHRLASDGTVRGIFETAVSFCWEILPHLRIDTHKDNAVMRHVIEKNGFRRCGIIYIADGTPRIAYEKIKGDKNTE